MSENELDFTNIEESCCSNSSVVEESTPTELSFVGDVVDLESNQYQNETKFQTTTTNQAATSSSHHLPQRRYKKAEFWIHGMTCTVCSGTIEQSIRNSIPEVESIAISLATDTATITWSDDDDHSKDMTVMTLEIRNAIETVGYTVEKIVIAKDSYPVVTDHDHDHNSTELNGHHVDSNSNNNDNNFNPPISSGIDEIEERWQMLQNRQKEKVEGRKQAFLWSLLGTVPILLLTMVIPHNWFPILHQKVVIYHHRTTELEALLLWILATPVQFISGWEFYRGAFFAIFIAGRAGMDVLIALGTTASYSYAVVGVWSGDTMSAHFFETSAVLICFVLGGKWMQALAVRRTSQALTQLLELQAKTATKVTALTTTTTTTTTSTTSFDPTRDPYHEEVVPIQNIHTGDIVKIIQGTSIPADGTVLFGEMSVDESMVTGEAMPVLKTVGSSVLGGTVCVETGVDGRNIGASFCEVTGVGAQTALAQIVQLVHDAQTRTVPIQTFADSISALFVPVVCTISVVTFLVWYALCSTHVVPSSWYVNEKDPMTFSILFAIACLVISCPCALGLATPTAIMVGTGVSAKLGILLKGGESLEIASTVDSVIFDKTGTLTKGKPVVSDFLKLDEKGQAIENQILWLLGSLERSLEHPLAKAIVKFVEEKLGEDNMDDDPFEQPSDFRSLTGRGALGRFGDTLIAVGNRAFAEMHNYDVTFVAEECMQSLEEEGKTAVLIAINGIVKAILGIVDEIKEDAGPAISYLQSEMGVDVWMVTGDNKTTAAAVGRKLGLPEDRIIAEALPATKLEHVRKLQAEGKVVAMVGDGINDSPALAQADVGLSLGTGAAIANEASDIVLVKGHVVDVCTALNLSRAIFKRIQWNFVWSLFYNCLGIPIAAGVFYPVFRVRLPPTVAALAMALSSVSVVVSSLTLRWYQPPSIDVSSRRQRQRERRRSRRPRGQQQHEEVVSIGSDINDNDTMMSARLLDHDYSEWTEATDQIDNRTVRRSV